jgi:hypothetical protein
LLHAGTAWLGRRPHSSSAFRTASSPVPQQHGCCMRPGRARLAWRPQASSWRPWRHSASEANGVYLRDGRQADCCHRMTKPALHCSAAQGCTVAARWLPAAQCVLKAATGRGGLSPVTAGGAAHASLAARCDRGVDRRSALEAVKTGGKGVESQGEVHVSRTLRPQWR